MRDHWRTTRGRTQRERRNYKWTTKMEPRYNSKAHTGRREEEERKTKCRCGTIDWEQGKSWLKCMYSAYQGCMYNLPARNSKNSPAYSTGLYKHKDNVLHVLVHTLVTNVNRETQEGNAVKADLVQPIGRQLTE